MIILVEPSSWEPGRMHYFWKFPLYAVVTTKDMPLLPWVADSDMLRWRSFRSWQDDETAPDACGRWWGVKLRVAAAALCVCSVWELGRWGLCFNNMVPPIEEMNQKASVFLWRGFPGKSEILPLKDENFNLPTLWPKPGNHAPCFQERIGIRWCMRACDLEVRKLRSER